LARIVHLKTGMRSGPTHALIIKGLTAEYLRHHRICPIGVAEDGAIRLLAAPDAQLGDSVDELAQAYGAIVRTEPASWSAVSDAIASLGVTDTTFEQGALTDEEISADLRDLASQPPVVRYVNRMIREAVDAGASDVHLEAVRDGAVARLRVDGALTAATGPAPQHREAVLSRLKLLAGLDIAETRAPQDGRLRVRAQARELDIRVSTVPSMHGESVVLRLLDRAGRPTRLEQLGLSTAMHAALSELVQRSHGLVLVTGPTGSGKTTTLYAALHDRDLRNEKVITVEDPIEYELQDVVQVPVNRNAGVSFPEALRSLLRQDPDVMLIGELRDRETAELAVQAALTGHQVFSTLHTNDAWTAMPRLMDWTYPENVDAYVLETTRPTATALRTRRG
jgi:type II secretory ATPase GspE/PulE/Tfp pilus assembly ATPase PilB-like protein